VTATAARIRTDSPRRVEDGVTYDRLYPGNVRVRVYVHDATGRDVPPDTVLGE
jgi:hypothetical protein